MRLATIARPGRLLAYLRPRSIQDRRLPVALGGLAVALTLPMVAGAGWPLLGWALGAGLWAAAQLVGAALALFFGRTSLGAGVVAVGLTSRGILVVFALLSLAAADPMLALAAAIVYAVSYGVELTFTLALYF